MTDKEPTQEQIKEFWKWCGFKEVKYLNTPGESCASHFISPDGTWRKGWLPDFDLNNLFKYAVPKLYGVQITYPSVLFNKPSYMVEIWIVQETKEPVTTYNQDPALALFWAIYSIIDKSPPTWEVIKK